MSNFKVGDWVYASDWCHGQIVYIYDDYAEVEYETVGGGGSCAFRLNELQKADPPRYLTKRECVEYVAIELLGDVDLEELDGHLSMNGYEFGLDKKRQLLFAFIDELSYVETILKDRTVEYGVKIY